MADPTPSSTRVVLLDRDGVINRDRPGSVCELGQFEMLPGAADAISRLSHAGYQVIVVTNQACVGRGDLSPEELTRIHRMLDQEVNAAGGHLAAILVCPHTDADGCACRKPKPGLIEQARARYAFEPGDTWMVGDSMRDVEAALSAGCRPALVRSGKPLPDELPAGLPVFADLAGFVDRLPGIDSV